MLPARSSPRRDRGDRSGGGGGGGGGRCWGPRFPLRGSRAPGAPCLGGAARLRGSGFARRSPSRRDGAELGTENEGGGVGGGRRGPARIPPPPPPPPVSRCWPPSFFSPRGPDPGGGVGEAAVPPPPPRPGKGAGGGGRHLVGTAGARGGGGLPVGGRAGEGTERPCLADPGSPLLPASPMAPQWPRVCPPHPSPRLRHGCPANLKPGPRLHRPDPSLRVKRPSPDSGRGGGFSSSLSSTRSCCHRAEASCARS